MTFLIEKAKTKPKADLSKAKVSAIRRRSSLHQIIKNEQQASSFMAALKVL
ncbi:hypothetical protein FLA_4211 [Filimonas lacunae]|nr:hypothetical protein FLA_4211 [Filimonas lacunae]